MSILALKRAYNRFFGAKKSVIGRKAYGKDSSISSTMLPVA